MNKRKLVVGLATANLFLTSSLLAGEEKPEINQDPLQLNETPSELNPDNLSELNPNDIRTRSHDKIIDSLLNLSDQAANTESDFHKKQKNIQKWRRRCLMDLKNLYNQQADEISSLRQIVSSLENQVTQLKVQLNTQTETPADAVGPTAFDFLQNQIDKLNTTTRRHDSWLRNDYNQNNDLSYQVNDLAGRTQIVFDHMNQQRQLYQIEVDHAERLLVQYNNGQILFEYAFSNMGHLNLPVDVKKQYKTRLQELKARKEHSHNSTQDAYPQYTS